MVVEDHLHKHKQNASKIQRHFLETHQPMIAAVKTRLCSYLVWKMATLDNTATVIVAPKIWLVLHDATKKSISVVLCISDTCNLVNQTFHISLCITIFAILKVEVDRSRWDLWRQTATLNRPKVSANFLQRKWRETSAERTQNIDGCRNICSNDAHTSTETEN